jgi:hypothetical protein
VVVGDYYLLGYNAVWSGEALLDAGLDLFLLLDTEDECDMLLRSVS